MKEVEIALKCSSKDLVIIGDRYLTDVVFGNMNGSFTIYVPPISTDGENIAVYFVFDSFQFLLSYYLVE